METYARHDPSSPSGLIDGSHAKHVNDPRADYAFVLLREWGASLLASGRSVKEVIDLTFDASEQATAQARSRDWIVDIDRSSLLKPIERYPAGIVALNAVALTPTAAPSSVVTSPATPEPDERRSGSGPTRR